MPEIFSMDWNFNIFVHACSSLLFIAGSTGSCLNDLTTVIEDVHVNGNAIPGNYSHFDIVNNTHFKVCQCEVKPCLKKCCGKNQIMAEDICRNAPQDMFTSETEILPKYNLTKFYLIYGKGCPINHFTRFYPDEYSNVKYYLDMNGSLSIFFDQEERQIKDFCLERVFRSENSSSELLVCIKNEFSSGAYDFPLGMALSIPFLLAILIIYSLRELRNIHGKNLTSYVTSLLIAYSSVIFAETAKPNMPESLCIVLGFVRQFSFLSSFFWLNVMCFDLWWSLSANSAFATHSRENERKKFGMYSVCGWGCPAVIVSVTAAMEFVPVPKSFIKPGIRLPNCFLPDGKPFYAYFYGPVIFIFCTDIMLFILSAARFVTITRKMQMATVQDKIYVQSTKTRYFLILKLFAMMGINWIIDPFSWIFESSMWTWLFVHLSVTIQAVSMFIIFVCKSEVKDMILLKFRANSYREVSTISLISSPPRDCTASVKKNTHISTSC